LAVVAEWDPADPNRRLRKLSDQKSKLALEDLETSLQQRLESPETATAGLRTHLSRDVGQLREALDGVVEQRRLEASEKLSKRGEEEAARFIKVLEEQRQRILSTRSRIKDNPDQLLIDLGDIADADELKAVRRQIDDNRKYWELRLRTIDTDLATEPDRIRRTFELRTHRVEPAGAIYLWPQGAQSQEAEPEGADTQEVA
jgi:hypothetical protein